MSDCKAEGEHWEEVEKYQGIPLCRRHRLILVYGGKIQMRANIDTKGWRFLEGTIS